MLTLEITIFGLKFLKKIGLEKNILEFHYLPFSEIPDNQPGKFSLSGQQQLWACGISK